jgi:hypothetical protein
MDDDTAQEIPERRSNNVVSFSFDVSNILDAEEQQIYQKSEGQVMMKVMGFYIKSCFGDLSSTINTVLDEREQRNQILNESRCHPQNLSGNFVTPIRSSCPELPDPQSEYSRKLQEKCPLLKVYLAAEKDIQTHKDTFYQEDIEEFDWNPERFLYHINQPKYSEFVNLRFAH